MGALRAFRDTITGRFTTRQDADARPAETVRETVDHDRVALTKAHDALTQVVRLCDAPWSPEGEQLRLQAIRSTAANALPADAITEP